MDENQFTRRTEDKSGTCYSHDPFGEDVREEQDGDNSDWLGSAKLFCLHFPVICFVVYPP